MDCVIGEVNMLRELMANRVVIRLLVIVGQAHVFVEKERRGVGEAEAFFLVLLDELLVGLQRGRSRCQTDVLPAGDAAGEDPCRDGGDFCRGGADNYVHVVELSGLEAERGSAKTYTSSRYWR